eukprot:scaffold155113_cov23-Prasinocladus_malaysianus.AAC.1
MRQPVRVSHLSTNMAMGESVQTVGIGGRRATIDSSIYLVAENQQYSSSYCMVLKPSPVLASVPLGKPCKPPEGE